MDNGGLRDLIFKIISSWQVIVATVVIIIYVFFVNFVSQVHYRRRQVKFKHKKAKAQGKATPEAEVTDDSELGLEE